MLGNASSNLDIQIKKIWVQVYKNLCKVSTKIDGSFLWRAKEISWVIPST